MSIAATAVISLATSTFPIDCFGKRYPLIRQSPNKFEYTEILEVSLNG